MIAVSAKIDDLAYDAVWGLVIHLTNSESGLAFVTDLNGRLTFGALKG